MKDEYIERELPFIWVKIILNLLLFNLIDRNSQFGDLLGWKALLHIEGVSKRSQLLLGELAHLALPSRLDENQSLLDRSPT